MKQCGTNRSSHVKILIPSINYLIYFWRTKFVLSFLINFLTVFIISWVFSQKNATFCFFCFLNKKTTEPVQREINQFNAANCVVPHCFIYLIFDIYICLNNERHPWKSFCKCPRNVAHRPRKNAPVNFSIRQKRKLTLIFNNIGKNFKFI